MGDPCIPGDSRQPICHRIWAGAIKESNMEDMEMVIMDIIVQSGNARSLAMQAIADAKEGNFEAANAQLDEADEALGGSHRVQTELIQKEAAGERTEMSLLMVHAQDHMMTAAVVRDLAREMVELYSRLAG